MGGCPPTPAFFFFSTSILIKKNQYKSKVTSTVRPSGFRPNGR